MYCIILKGFFVDIGGNDKRKYIIIFIKLPDILMKMR